MTSPLRTPLILSLVINLLMVGLVAGFFLLRPPPPPPPPQEQTLSAVDEVAAQLPEEKATRLRDTMAKAFEEVKEKKKLMKKARNQTTAILRAEQFDPEAYQQEVSRLHALRGEMMQRMANATMEAAAELNPEERALLADTFKRYHGYWRKCAPPPQQEAAGRTSPPPR